VSMRAVARAAGRVVREAAHLAGCEIDVARVPDEPPTAIEAATLELALSALLLAGLARAGAGHVLRVDRPDDDAAALLRVAHVPVPADGAPGGHWEPAGLTLAAALLAEAGGRLAAPGGRRGALPADLADAPTLHLTLPAHPAPVTVGAAPGDPA
jgi:hypothetical protein